MICRKKILCVAACWMDTSTDRPAVTGLWTLTQQTGHFFAATETINIDAMLMEQIHVEIAEWSRVFQHGVGLMPVSTSRNDSGKIVTKVFRGIPKITANHNGRVVKQGSLSFFNLIAIRLKKDREPCLTTRPLWLAVILGIPRNTFVTIFPLSLREVDTGIKPTPCWKTLLHSAISTWICSISMASMLIVSVAAKKWPVCWVRVQRPVTAGRSVLVSIQQAATHRIFFLHIIDSFRHFLLSQKSFILKWVPFGKNTRPAMRATLFSARLIENRHEAYQQLTACFRRLPLHKKMTTRDWLPSSNVIPT